MDPQDFINIYTPNQNRPLPLDEELKALSIQKFIDHVKKVLGFSSRIFAYTEPICSRNKLAHLPLGITIRSALEVYPRLAFTYNNTQYHEEPEYNRLSQLSTKS